MASGMGEKTTKPSFKEPSVLSSSSVYYVSHSLPCVELADVLLQLRSFSEQHPGEVLVVRICRDWDNRECFGVAQGDEVLDLVGPVAFADLYMQCTLHTEVMRPGICLMDDSLKTCSDACFPAAVFA